MEAVDIRADELSRVCVDGEISLNEIDQLRKRFKIIQTRFYQIKKPEEKGKHLPMRVPDFCIPSFRYESNS